MDTAQRMLEAVVRLDDPAAADPAVAGRKAATLAGLLADGFPVPPGAVLTTHGCERILASGPAAEPGGPGALPDEVRLELAQVILHLGEVPLAVRSSGVAEDTAGASYAGQYETLLGVRGFDALVDAVLRCLASASSERVAAYRAAGGRAGPAPMAVLVQRLIHPDAAGVAFTANPVTGDRETLVSAVRGLGERLVSGEATPDEWVVRGAEAECLASPEGAIDAEQARRLAAMAARVEETLGGPQDIEWAIAGSELFLLQARPITALPAPPQIDVPTEGYWMKDDAHYPAPLTPFGASVYLPALTQGVGPLCERFGLLMDGVDQRSLGGEAYMRMIPMGGKDRKAPPWWVLWAASRVAPPIRRRARVAREALRADLGRRLIDRWNDEWRDEFRTEASSLRGRDLAALDDEEVLAHLDSVLDLMNRGQRAHFLLWGAYVLPVYELGLACEELLGWDPAETLSLVSGTSAASSEPGRALDDLAAAIGRSPAAREIISAGGSDLMDRLREVAPDAADAFRAYLNEHGHRTLSYDPGDSTLAERPELLAGLVRDRLAGGGSSVGDVDRVREGTLARARAGLAGRTAEERDRFERALAAAERAYPCREDNIIWTDNVPSGLLRYTAMEIGRRLAERGVIGGAEDAVFLEDAELRAALRSERGDLRELVARRRAERAWVVAHPGPASYGKEPGPPPDLRGLPPALRHVTGALMWFMELIFQPAAAGTPGDSIPGVPGSPGAHTGTVRVIRDASGFGRLCRGDVLVCPITSPAWSVLFSQAGAVVTDGGGVLAHAAVIAREYGIPAVLATGDATRRLRDGQIVTVDGTAGAVKTRAVEGTGGRRLRSAS